MESDLTNTRIFFQWKPAEFLRTQLYQNQHDLQRLVQVDSGPPSPLLPGWLSCSCPCSCHVITYPLGSISLFLQSGLFYLLQSDWTIWVPYISLSVSRLKTVLGLVFLLTMLLPLPCLSPFLSLKVQHKGLFLWEVWSFQNLPKSIFSSPENIS